MTPVPIIILHFADSGNRLHAAGALFSLSVPDFPEPPVRAGEFAARLSGRSRGIGAAPSARAGPPTFTTFQARYTPPGLSFRSPSPISRSLPSARANSPPG